MTTMRKTRAMGIARRWWFNSLRAWRAIGVVALTLTPLPETAGASNDSADLRCPHDVASHGPWSKSSARLPREAAFLSKYALLSLLAYDDRATIPQRHLPPTITQTGPFVEHWSGLRVRFFIDHSPTPNEMIVAITGTDQLRDWLTQNLLPLQRRVFFRRLELLVASAEGPLARVRQEGLRLTFTGHSLGGGLAIGAAREMEDSHASFWHERPRAIAFNSSPRYAGGWNRRDAAQKTSDRERVVLFESADPTRIVGNALFFWRAQTLSCSRSGRPPPVWYCEVDFSHGFFLRAHNMCTLATGIAVAANADYIGVEEVRSILLLGCETLRGEARRPPAEAPLCGARGGTGQLPIPENPFPVHTCPPQRARGSNSTSNPIAKEK